MTETQSAVANLLGKINAVILNPIIFLLFGVALLVFLFGIFQFIAHNDDESAREKGKSSMVWGLVGLFVMFSVFGIIQLILDSLGIPKAYPFN
jgi:uncharacterized membrane protein YbhN (UPF0104 family)